MSSSWALIEDDDELLFVRRAFDVGRGGQWCPPGGTIWERERPDVACIRETYEETGLRTTVESRLAVFEDAHYFLCSLNAGRDALSLHPDECIGAAWIDPASLLELGTIMDLRRILPLLELAGLEAPPTPEDLETAVPERTFVH
jgi:ADP-ribose pyrophosphatase YjhB (NUDIX family)